MATITGFTSARMLAIENGTVVDGEVIGGELILTKRDGTTINAGSVVGPQGPAGSSTGDTSVVSARQVLSIGQANQIVAGRQLVLGDFTTNQNLQIPVGIWNLGNLNDSSGNNRTLTNKGNVLFDTGVGGAATSAARFSLSAAQALYIADTGAADPFRLKVGSFGCWAKTPKRGATQDLLSKMGQASPNFCWHLYANAGDVGEVDIFTDGTNGVLCTGTKVICDHNWHFVVATYDGAVIRLYVDGVLDGSAGVSVPTPIFGAAVPFNIGGYGADGSNNAGYPWGGRIDEAFVTSDVLSLDQIRYLYGVKISHTLAAYPARFSIKRRKAKRGSAPAVSDFPTTPLRLYNFSAGVLTDGGSNNATLTNNGSVAALSGADGRSGNGMVFSGANNLSGTDSGLPSGTTARSFGGWFFWPSSGYVNSGALVSYGATSSDNGLLINNSGYVALRIAGTEISGAATANAWHYIVGVCDASADSGALLKLYIDGKLINTSPTFNSTANGGAGKFRIGCWPDVTLQQKMMADGVFVCGYALLPEQINSLYNKPTQLLASPGPVNPQDHIIGANNTDLIVVFDTLQGCDQVDIGVAA